MNLLSLLKLHHSDYTTLKEEFVYSLILHASTSLLSVSLNNVTVFQVHLLGSGVWVDTRTVNQKSDGVRRSSLSLTEGIHQSLHWGSPLDLEEDLASAVTDLQVDVGVGWFLLCFLCHFLRVSGFEVMGQNVRGLVVGRFSLPSSREILTGRLFVCTPEGPRGSIVLAKSEG